MAVNGKVEILPMMYLALSYDHRQIDGKESVGFLTFKELLEDPTRLLLNKKTKNKLLNFSQLVFYFIALYGFS